MEGLIMRFLKKTPVLLMAVPLLLTSCSNGSIAGTYGFQMGKESGTHFGIYVKLTDKKYTTSDPAVTVSDKAKQCDFSFSIKFGDDTEIISSIITIIAKALGQEGNKITVPGYYYRGKTIDNEGGFELKVGVDTDFFKKIFDGIDLPQDLDFPVLDPETIEKVMYTTYSTNIVTMNVPVSEVDVIYQLYWYGIDFSYSEEEGIKIVHLPAEQVHEAGTHPTAEQVAVINETYGTNHQAFVEKFQLNISTYRDFYTLALDLVKK